MTHIIARTHMGARDLFHGVPNLKWATIIEVVHPQSPVAGTSPEFGTTLIIKDTKGQIHKITIAQA